MYIGFVEDLANMILKCKQNLNYHGFIFIKEPYDNERILKEIISLLIFQPNIVFRQIQVIRNNSKTYLIKFENDSYIYITNPATGNLKYHQAIVDPKFSCEEFTKLIYPNFIQYRKHKE